MRHKNGAQGNATGWNTKRCDEANRTNAVRIGSPGWAAMNLVVKILTAVMCWR